VAAGRPPFRADHVGSLLRPATLKRAFRERAAGTLDEAGFQAAMGGAIRDIVRLQEDVGLEVVNDGEFRRGSYWGHFVERAQGLGIGEARFKFRDESGGTTGFTAPVVASKVSRAAPISVDEVAFVSAITRLPVKVTLPAPSTMHFWRGSAFAESGAYRDAEAFYVDLTAIYRAEIAALVAAGARYVQFDEVAMAMLCDPAVRDMVRADGLDPDGLVDLYVGAINDCVAGAPAGVTLAVHMCRGNFKGKYLSEGGYERVAERLFASAHVNHFLLEYDTARAGDFTPLSLMPRDTGCVLGLVSSKVPALESVDALRRRIEEASRFIDLDRLAISPQCGFASTVAGNPVSEDDMRAKLRRCVEVAQAVWC
jgi:5-methyltetrahydropteroyltriglutamate--homocysteine methyltransferase